MTLRELQLFALEILKDVHQFCTENNIKYSLYGGTLLGAVRHKGFIPWDDDVDIIMPRPDYDLFCKKYKSKNYILKCRDNDKSFQLAYSRVCDNKKTIYTTIEPCSKKTTGVWIDVFPADGCPPNEADIPSFYKENQSLFLKTESIRFSMASIPSEWIRTCRCYGYISAIKHVVRLVCKKVIYLSSGQMGKWIKLLINTNKKYSFITSYYWASFSCPYKHVVYHPKDDFSKCLLMQFEDTMFYAMNGYDNYLRRVYGNYMELPPKDHQVPPLGGWYKFYWI